MGFKKTTETGLVKACLQYLRLRRILAWRQNTTGIKRTDRAGREFWTSTGVRGVSDILGLLAAGRFLAVEVKRPGQKLTAAQQAFLDQVNALGGLGVCVHSVRELEAALAGKGA